MAVTRPHIIRIVYGQSPGPPEGELVAVRKIDKERMPGPSDVFV